MQTALSAEQAGARHLLRPQGPALQHAMSLRVDRLDTTTGGRRVVEAPELFAELAHAEVTTPDGVVPLPNSAERNC